MPVLRLRWREMVRETNLKCGKLIRMQGKEQGTISDSNSSCAIYQLHLFVIFNECRSWGTTRVPFKGDMHGFSGGKRKIDFTVDPCEGMF